ETTEEETAEEETTEEETAEEESEDEESEDEESEEETAEEETTEEDELEFEVQPVEKICVYNGEAQFLTEDDLVVVSYGDESVEMTIAEFNETFGENYGISIDLERLKEQAITDVGMIVIDFELQGSSEIEIDGVKYEVDDEDSVLKVDPRIAIAEIMDLQKSYGDKDPEQFPIVILNVVEGDEIDPALTREIGEQVGDYQIRGDADIVEAGNYILVYKTGYLTIAEPSDITKVIRQTFTEDTYKEGDEVVIQVEVTNIYDVMTDIEIKTLPDIRFEDGKSCVVASDVLPGETVFFEARWTVSEEALEDGELTSIFVTEINGTQFISQEKLSLMTEDD
ncbi:MAG: MBG domain-containing protein, partial [Christensenellales bacterium]|nr:MBG domain-containing protein [Christensenellales bacterium]